MPNSSNFTSVTVTVGTSETELAAYNEERESMILFNQGGEDIKFYFDDAAAYVLLESGKGMHFGNIAPVNELNAVTDSGTSVVTVMEG